MGELKVGNPLEPVLRTLQEGLSLSGTRALLGAICSREGTQRQSALHPYCHVHTAQPPSNFAAGVEQKLVLAGQTLRANMEHYLISRNK